MFDRRIILVLFLSILPALVAGCASNNPSTAIIGTWQTGIKNKKRTMTFWENGAWNFDNSGQIQTGIFKFVAENQIEITVDGPQDETPTIYKRILFFAHHDMMHLTDADTGMRTTWKRIEQQ